LLRNLLFIFDFYSIEKKRKKKKKREKRENIRGFLDEKIEVDLLVVIDLDSKRLF